MSTTRNGEGGMNYRDGMLQGVGACPMTAGQQPVDQRI